jgi:hypothetical protein
MPFLAIALGIPLLVFFLLVSGLLLIPFFAIRAGIRAKKRLADRPPSTRVLRQTLEEISDPFPSTEAFMRIHSEQLVDAWKDRLPQRPLFNRIVGTAGTLYSAEGFDPLEPPPPLTPDAIAYGRYRDDLIAGIRTAREASQILAIIHSTLAASFGELVRKLPASTLSTRAQLLGPNAPEPAFSVGLIDMVRNPGQAIADLIRPFHAPEVAGLKLFSALRAQFNRNLYEASGQRYPAPVEKLIHPYDHPGSPKEIVKAYLAYTPLQYIFDLKTPFPVTPERRVEHWHLIGSSGWGKSQTLQHIILHDLTRSDPPALVIVDSQGDMLGKIQRLALFEADPERLVIVDPEHNPSLNMFNMTTDRLADYSPIVREQVEAGIIELYSYIFGALASELTAKQGTAFAFVVRLMLAIPGATLRTLLELMEDNSKSLSESPFAQPIARLDRTARSFFENQFFNKQAFGNTRQQIARRLYAVLSVPAFDRMFSAPRNKLDMFAAIQGQKVVLVNTAKSLLKTDASALFGRYMIAQVMAAAFERVAVPYRDRKPAYLIIDEAAEYFDDSLESLLSQARKFQLGVLFAHQHMEQLTPALRSSVASNTSIKMAGGVSDRDARMLDADMRTSSEFISSMHKRNGSTEFAAYIRNETPTAVRLEVPFGTMERAPRMSPEVHRRLVALNRARYSSDPEDLSNEEPDRRETENITSTSHDDDIRPSKDW